MEPRPQVPLARVHSVLRAVLNDCRQHASHVDNVPGAGVSDELLACKRMKRAFVITCRALLASHGFVGECGYGDLLLAVYHHKADPYVIETARTVETVLGCQEGTLFGLVPDPPTSVSLAKARRIMGHLRYYLDRKDTLTKLRALVSTGVKAVEIRWNLCVMLWSQVSMAHGFGVEGLHHMLDACMAHKADPNITAWARDLERGIGLPLGALSMSSALQDLTAAVERPSWPVEQLRAYILELVAVYSTPAYEERWRQLAEKHTGDAHVGPWVSELLDLWLQLEAPLRRKYGLGGERATPLRYLRLRSKILEEHATKAELQVILRPSAQRPQLRSDEEASEVASTAVVVPPASPPPWSACSEDFVSLPAQGEEVVEACELTELPECCDSKDTHIANLTARVAHQGEEVSQVWAELVVRDQEISRLAGQLVTQSTVVSQLQAETLAKDRTIATLTAKVADHSLEMSRVQEQALATDRFVADLTATMAGSGGQAKALDGVRQGTELVARVAEQGEAIMQMEEEMSELHAHLRARRSEIVQLSATIVEQSGTSSNWQEQDLERQDFIRCLESRLADQARTISLWREEALDMDNQLARLQAEVEEWSVSHRAYEFFEVREADISWGDAVSSHCRGSLQQGCPAWAQIDARFRSSSGHLYELVKIELVRNKRLERACSSMLHCSESHAEMLSSTRQWQTDGTKRRTLHVLEEHLVADGHPNLIWAWHDCDPRFVDTLVDRGFGELPHTHPVIFGCGHYCVLEAATACQQARLAYRADKGCWCIVLVLAALGNVYPVSWCHEDFNMLDPVDPADCKHYGQRLKEPIGAHVVPVERRGESSRIATGPAEHHEVIFDQSAQILPFAICWFRPSAPGHPDAAASAVFPKAA